MKKALLLTAVATLVTMSSCMRDEVVDVNKGQAIGFRTSVETRGLEAKSATIDAIYVTALEDENDNPYFSEVPFVLVGYDNYTSSEAYYWPGQDRKLKFYAYAPGEDELGEGATVTITNTEKLLKNFVVKENISEQVDFVYAENDGNGEGLEEQTNVSLNFQHKLSKIEVRATTSSDYVYKFAGVRIGGVYGKGDLKNLSGEDWEIDTDAGKKTFTKELTEGEIVEVTKNTGSESLLGTNLNLNDYAVDEYAFMIPQQFAPWNPETDSQNQNGGAYIAVKVQISTSAGVRVFPKENDDYAWVAIPIIGSEVLDESGYARTNAYQWKGDYAYSYTLDFTKGAGYIEPNIDNLQSGTPVLGDGAVVKMTMTLGQMQEGVEDLVVNPNMLGKWTAQTFKLTQTYYKMLVDEGGNAIYDAEGNRQCALDEDGKRIVLWSKITELEGADVIGPQIDNFANITILDGTYMIIKDKKGNEGEIEYFVNDENYILIECYRDSGEFGSLDAGHYSPSPKISSIVRATPTSDGQAKIIVEDTGRGSSDSENGVYEPYIWEDEMILTYDIEYLAKDSE